MVGRRHFLTQPRSGVHVGSRAQRSLKIRMTMTQERSPLALACEQKWGLGNGGAKAGKAIIVKKENHASSFKNQVSNIKIKRKKENKLKTL